MSLRPDNTRERVTAGKRDRLITIQRATYTTNEFNERVYAWSALASVWAGYLPVSDGERMRASQLGAELTGRFHVPHLSVVASVNPKDRIVMDGDTFDILGVKEIGRREGLEITALKSADEPAVEGEAGWALLFNQSQYSGLLPLLEDV